MKYENKRERGVDLWLLVQSIRLIIGSLCITFTHISSRVGVSGREVQGGKYAIVFGALVFLLYCNSSRGPPSSFWWPYIPGLHFVWTCALLSGCWVKNGVETSEQDNAGWRRREGKTHTCLASYIATALEKQKCYTHKHVWNVMRKLNL